MANYKIINDVPMLLEFIDFLPDLQVGELFYVNLIARNKYSSIKIKSQHSLRRFTANKKNLFEKIWQLETEIGSYSCDGAALPQDSLALYIMPNPRSLEKATKNALIRFANLVTSTYNGYNPYSEVMSEIQKSKSRTCFVDFDFDDVEVETFISQITGKINLSAIKILKTRGGFHCLVRPQLVDVSFGNWHKSISSTKGCDVTGDTLIPVPGCVQGDFTPHFI